MRLSGSVSSRERYHWHKHDEEDEFFYVVEGQLLIELDNQTITLAPRQGFVVPKGIVHRTRAPQRTASIPGLTHPLRISRSAVVLRARLKFFVFAGERGRSSLFEQ